MAVARGIGHLAIACNCANVVFNASDIGWSFPLWPRSARHITNQLKYRVIAASS
jgi:hypothetical protein